jgi:hypothetical protein
MEQNITMQELKQQRLTPAEKFVLDTIKGVKPRKPDEDGNIDWQKDGYWVFMQCFKENQLWINRIAILLVLEGSYSLKYGEIEQLLTRLLHKYTNNGQLKIKI